MLVEQAQDIAGAVQLARSDAYEQQAFALGRAYALQFHLEVDAALAARWMEVPEYVTELEELAGPGAPAAMLEQVTAHEHRSVPLARELFGRWLERVAGVAGSGEPARARPGQAAGRLP